MTKGIAIKYSEEQVAFLHANKEISRKELTTRFNEAFGTNIDQVNITAKCKRIYALTGRTGRFEKGQQSWNKGLKGYMGVNSTSFKKGHTPSNHKPVGHERITVDGYIEVKISEPNVFELKHRQIWEQQHGKIPDNHVLVFKNMNKQDCRLENLMLVSRAELVRLNQSYRKLATPETNETCVLMAKIKNKTHNLKVA